MVDIFAMRFDIARSISSEVYLEVDYGSKVNAYIFYLGIVKFLSRMVAQACLPQAVYKSAYLSSTSLDNWMYYTF